MFYIFSFNFLLIYKDGNAEEILRKSMQKKQLLKVKNGLLELEKGFIKLKDREVKTEKEVTIF